MRAKSDGRGMVRSVLAVFALLFVSSAAAAADSPTVRVTRPAAGRVVLDVSDNAVTVRKEITAEGSVVTMTTARDRLTIAVRRGVLTISGPTGAMTADPGTGVDSNRLLVVMQQSEAARRARTLLAKVTDGPNTFVGQSVLLTRTVLELGTGTVEALNQHQQWVADQASRMPARRFTEGPRFIRAAFIEPQKTPGECWEIYSKEAIKIADDFSDCTEDLSWYEVHLWAACTLIYTLRSEAAMAWFISCNGGLPVVG